MRVGVRVKRLVTCLWLSASMLCLPGCWDYQRINDRMTVTGIGIDPVQDQGNMLRWTFQSPQFSASAKGGAGGEAKQGQGEPKQFANFVVDAQDLEDALVKAQTMMEKQVFLGNLQTVIMSTKLSPEQIRNTTVQLIRHPTLDKLAFVLMTDQSAETIYGYQDGLSPSDQIDRFLGGSVEQRGYTISTRLWEFWRDDVDVGIDARAGMVSMEDNKLKLAGMYVLTPGTRVKQQQATAESPATEVQPENTSGFNFAVGAIRRFSLSVGSGDQSFVLGNVDGSSRIGVKTTGTGQVQLVVKVRAQGRLTDDTTNGVTPVKETELRQYEQAASKEIEKKVEATLHMFQEQGVDPYGFGRKYALAHPKLFETVDQTWYERFKTAQPDIQVTVTIPRKGTLV